MKKGEKYILWSVVGMLALSIGQNLLNKKPAEYVQAEKGIPYYSTATPALSRAASDLIRANGCRQCHSFWSVRDIMQSVPSPSLDGMGDLRSEAWLYAYLSSKSPQIILPSRLKPEYRMPSFAMLSDNERHTLAKYLASLHAKDWYVEETKKNEYQKLTGKDDYKK